MQEKLTSKQNVSSFFCAFSFALQGWVWSIFMCCELRFCFECKKMRIWNCKDVSTQLELDHSFCVWSAYACIIRRNSWWMEWLIPLSFVCWIARVVSSAERKGERKKLNVFFFCYFQLPTCNWSKLNTHHKNHLMFCWTFFYWVLFWGNDLEFIWCFP